MQRQGVMDDQRIQSRQLGREKLLDFRFQGGKFGRDLSLVEGVAYRADLRMTRVQLGDDDELDGACVGKGLATPAQDGGRIAAGGEASRLLIAVGLRVCV